MFPMYVHGNRSGFRMSVSFTFRPHGIGRVMLAPREGCMATEAYCVKCREKREMKDEEEVTMKNGRPAVQGICPICGTKLFRIKSTKKAE